MNHRVLIAVTAVLAATALAQTPSPQQKQRIDERLRILEQRALGAPNGTWKQLSDDVSLLVFKTDAGDYRGRLYVRIGETWQAVATDGLGDLSRVLPAK